MNFDAELERMASEIKELSGRRRDLAKRHAEARAFTAQFLSKCGEAGMSIAGIAKLHPELGREKFSFGERGSVFSHPDDRYNGWPAIWYVVKALGISNGAGNTGQHQADTSKLIDGVYRCTDGEWARIDD